MGQDSSQLAGTSQNDDGVIIKPDPEEKENENLREVSNWDGDAVEEGLLRSGRMKGVEGRKKKRKKRRASSFSKATYETAKDTTVRQTLEESGGTANNSQWTQEAGQSDVARGTPSSTSRNHKQAQLEAKKRRLLAVATTAAGNVNSPYSDAEFIGPASGEHNNIEGEDEGEMGRHSQSNGVGKPVKMAKSLNSVAAHLITSRAVNDRRSGRLTPEASQRTEVSSTSKMLKTKKSKSRLVSTSLTAGDEEDQSTTDLLLTPNASSRIRSQQSLEDPFSSHVKDSQILKGKRRSNTDERGSTNRLDKRKTIAEYSTHTNHGPSDEDMGGESSESRGYCHNISPSGAVMTSARRQSSAQDMELIDPALRDIGIESNQEYQQVGVHRDAATPEIIGNRKNRLTLDRDIPEQTPRQEPLRKKPRKQLLTQEASNWSVRKPPTREFREESLDLDAPSIKPNGRVSTSKRVRTSGPVTKGRFSEEELEIIGNEMLKYREMCDMTTFELNQTIQDAPGKLTKLWDEIREALPDRPRYAIIKVCRRKYHNFGARAKWTREEDQQLREAYAKFPNRWKEIGQILNRHHEDVRDRWRNYAVCGDSMKREYWTEEEENHLRLVIAECVQAVRELKAAEIARNPGLNLDPRPDIELIDWQIVSAKLGHTRSRLQCLDKWNRMVRLENSDDDSKELELGAKSWRVKNANRDVKNMRREDYIELLVALRNSHAGGESKVNWSKLGDLDLRTKWTCMARKVAWKKLRASVPGNEQMKFQDIVTTLINNPPEDDAELEGKDHGARTPVWDPMELGEPSPQKRALSDAISSMEGDENDRGVVSDDNIDPYLNEPGSNEFDHDDIEDSRIPFHQDYHNSNFNKGIPRGAVEERDNSVVRNEDEEDNNHLAITDRGSVDLDASSHRRGAISSTSRLRSPISFKVALDQDEQEDIDGPTSSDEDVDLDIPARRPFEISRHESEDLDRDQ